MSVCSETGENKSWFLLLGSFDMSRTKGKMKWKYLYYHRMINFCLRSEMAIWFWITGDKGRKFMKAVRIRIYLKNQYNVCRQHGKLQDCLSI